MNYSSFARILVFSFLIPLITIPAALAHAQHIRIIQKKEVDVLYEETLRTAAEEVAGIYPQLKGKLEKTFRWSVDFRPRILLIKDSKTFQKMAGSHLMVAFAIPTRNQVVIDYSRMRTHPFTIETTLKHELCHLLLHRYINRENLPRWLDEGIAQWVSEGIAEIIMDQKSSVLEEAILKGNYIRIGALGYSFPRDKESLLLAYEASKSLVEYVISSFGREGLLALLNHLRYDHGLERAVTESLSISLDELEGRWNHHLRRRITWFTYLINHLYEILFFFAALLVIYGAVKGLMKKRAYRDEEEEEPD